MRKYFIAFVAVMILATGMGFFTACDDDKRVLLSSRSYSGHENDQDSNNFVRAYPVARATRLDDCQLCHVAGANNGLTGTSRKEVTNVCSQCHLLEWPDSIYTANVPANFYDTLNAFGKAYKDNGQDVAAFTKISELDSDGDGSANGVEIADNRFPGDANSKPGQSIIPYKTITRAQLIAMTKTSQFLLMNTTKQQYDDYATYEGVKVSDFLDAADVDMTSSTGITVFAPDGFSKDHPKDDDGSAFTYDINTIYPHGFFYRISSIYENADATLNCVNYPQILPAFGDAVIVHQQEIPDNLFLMIAYKRDGLMLNKSYYDGTTGRLEGEGPFRLIPPQNVQSRPDRGSKSSQAEPTDGYNFLNSLDHNSGSSTRGACIIRVNPMPAGYEELDHNNGWAYIEDEVIVIYGAGVTAD